MDSSMSEDEGPTRIVVDAQIHRPVSDAIELEAEHQAPQESESDTEVLDVEAHSSAASGDDINVEAVSSASGDDAINVEAESLDSQDEGDGGNPIFGDGAKLPFEFLSMQPKQRKTTKKGWGRKPKRSGQDWKVFEDRKKAILKAAADDHARKQQEAAEAALDAQTRMEAIFEAFAPSDGEEANPPEPQDDGDNVSPEEPQLPEKGMQIR